MDPAFVKYDNADGKKSINIEETKSLLEELGFPVSDEKINEAMVDLDINGDGVIDFYEFKRWFFTGLQPYDQ